MSIKCILLQASSTRSCTDTCTKPGTVGSAGQSTNSSSRRRFMVPRPLYIVASTIQYPMADITATAGKKGQARGLWTNGRAKNYGTWVRKWSDYDHHKVKCSKTPKLISSFGGCLSTLINKYLKCFKKMQRGFIDFFHLLFHRSFIFDKRRPPASSHAFYIGFRGLSGPQHQSL